MPRTIKDDNQPNSQEDRLKQIETDLAEVMKFNKKLIEALVQAEKDTKNIYLPEGKYFGITID